MLRFVRIWLPALVTLAGVLIMAVRGFDEIGLEGGAGVIGAGLSIWLMNVIFRLGLDNDQDRDAEDAARDFYDANGHWPDEPKPVVKPAMGHRVARPPAPEAARIPRDRRPPSRPRRPT